MTNLNGLWDYAVTDTADGRRQTEDSRIPKFAGKILVPYPIESALSGVQQMLRANQYLWYRKTVNLNKSPGTKTLLHFGAVDNVATVFVNGKNIGTHKGGYTEFSFDITTAIKNGDNEIIVQVYDPTDNGVYPHGKQVSNPANIIIRQPPASGKPYGWKRCRKIIYVL
jgi:beta-galactosidase/beta-glucuronidase